MCVRVYIAAIGTSFASLSVTHSTSPPPTTTARTTTEASTTTITATSTTTTTAAAANDSGALLDTTESSRVWEANKSYEINAMAIFFQELHNNTCTNIVVNNADDNDEDVDEAVQMVRDTHTTINANTYTNTTTTTNAPPSFSHPNVVLRHPTVTATTEVSQTQSAVETREPLLKTESKKRLRRKLLFEDMEILNNAATAKAGGDIVYDVDDVTFENNAAIEITPTVSLAFDSRFECGNLRQAVRVYDTLYDLVLSPDINTEGHTQWFFFSVGRIKANTRYRFNILNLEKANSQLNFGMQPVMYTATCGWSRVGKRVCYYKNHLSRDSSRNKRPNHNYYSATFTVKFPEKVTKCFLAFHYPYSYTDNQLHLDRLASVCGTTVRRQLLCRTLGGNRCDVLTVTSISAEDERVCPVSSREYIILSGRVHPGETNASWMIKGLLDFITSDDVDAVELRRRFVFKVIPMLNPDGVANGNHRCSLAGCDLNRKWLLPHPTLHPTIYKTRLLFSYLQTQGITPALYCDFHGHSRKKMVFMYGCDESANVRSFPKRLDELDPKFLFKNCRFNVTSDKEGSSRVVVWRHYGVERSYTLESTFCGFDRGFLIGTQVSTNDLADMGKSFALSLLKLGEMSGKRSNCVSPTVVDLNANVVM